MDLARTGLARMREWWTQLWARASTDNAPGLMLDSGGHMAKITALIFTPDGEGLISASHDKTIRVWHIRSGETVRIIRGPCGPGNHGRIYAMALSPDGAWLAAGGFMAPDSRSNASDVGVIRLYEFATGRLAALLKAHKNVVGALAFSHDGTKLISGSNDKTAIVWDLASGRPMARFLGHSHQLYVAGFSSDDSYAITGGFKNALRFWRATTRAPDNWLLPKPAIRQKGHISTIRSLASSAAAGVIASGDDGGEVRLWDGRSGAFLRTLARQASSVISLSFSPDGRRLLLGGGSRPHTRCSVRDVASGAETASYAGHHSATAASAFSPDGLLVATSGAGAQEIHIWDSVTGERRRTLKGCGASVVAVGFAADGRAIGWANAAPSASSPGASHAPGEKHLPLPFGTTPLAGPHPLGKSSLPALQSPAWSREIPRLGARLLRHAKGGKFGYDDAILEIVQDGAKTLRIERDSSCGLGHSAYSFAPDGQCVVSGGCHGYLAAYDLNGARLKEAGPDAFIGHESIINAMAPSPDGRYLATGAADQTIRLWNLKTGELIVSVFSAKNGEWVMWTPQGFYAASPDGDQMVGWQINCGPDKTPEYVAAAQLCGHLYRPDIIASAIDLASARQAIRQAGASYNVAELPHLRPPEFTIVAPPHGSTSVHNPAQITLRVASNEEPVKGFKVTVNGRQARSGADAQAEPWVSVVNLDAPLERGDNHIRVTATNAAGETWRELMVKFAGRGDRDKRGVLHILAVGVDDYTGAAPLCFAGADAAAFLDTFVTHGGPLHAEVRAALLGGGGRPPTRANIHDALDAFRDARPEDTVVLFLAGHGANDGKDYLFLPQDAVADSDRWRRSTVITWLDFQNALQNAHGRRMMFVDTCHSGAAYNARLLKDAHSAEIIVFSAANGHTLARELRGLSHGVFTHALVEGLRGKADRDGRGYVGLFELQAYVSDQVEKLTQGAQSPAICLSGVTNFVIASGFAPALKS